MNSRTTFQIVFSLIVLILLLACTQTVSAQRYSRTSKKYAKKHVPVVQKRQQAQPSYYDEDYPDPKTIRAPQKMIAGTPAAPVNRDRYAKISEEEYRQRVCEEEYLRRCHGVEGVKAEPCPLCENDPKTPCGECKMCKAGFPCERTLCRHCVQQRSQNMCNSCDLSAGDEPCGTCDACREHRSDPCEHADDGHGPRGEFNPYKEPRFLSVIPRPILDTYNNGARKFPVYYNPAPYYRPHWNPSLYAGYARPYTFRWSCPLCYKDPCQCNKPGFAGQVPYAYACKFCNRNPCACTQDICNVNKELNPKGVSSSLADENKDSTKVQDTQKREERRRKEAEAQKAKANDEKRESILENDGALESLKKAPKKESNAARSRLLDNEAEETESDESFKSMKPLILDAPELNSPAPRRSGNGVVN